MVTVVVESTTLLQWNDATSHISPHVMTEKSLIHMLLTSYPLTGGAPQGDVQRNNALGAVVHVHGIV